MSRIAQPGWVVIVALQFFLQFCFVGGNGLRFCIPWFLSSLFIIRVPFFLLFGSSKGALK